MPNEKKPNRLIFKTGHSELAFGPENERGKLVVTNNFGGIECRYYLSAADILALQYFLSQQVAPELITAPEPDLKLDSEKIKKLDAELSKRFPEYGNPNDPGFPGRTCFESCGPSDFGPGGKCERMGCRKPDSADGSATANQ